MNFLLSTASWGNFPWVGFVFIREASREPPRATDGEAKDFRWLNLHKLSALVQRTPETVFTLQLPILKQNLRERLTDRSQL